jgi:4-hydroxy-tetrahydrodipicolinate synthase
MDRTSIDWKGYWPACPTPFTEKGALDLETFGLLIDWYLKEGMHGIFINGTTGEWFSQTPEERRELTEFAVSRVAGAIPVVVGITTFTARDSALLGIHAMSVGASGVCASAPAYSKTLPNETIAYFAELGNAIQAPLMVYNWPHGTNIEIEGELASALADLEYIVAIKDSTGNSGQFKETARSLIDRVRIFGNFMTPDSLKFMQEIGGDGTIGGGSIFGQLDPQFWNDYWAGDMEKASAHAKRNEVLLNKLWMPGGWRGKFGAYQSQLKLIMKLMGLPGGSVRAPRLPITDESSIQAIREILIESNIPVVK